MASNEDSKDTAETEQPLQTVGHEARQLTLEEQQKLLNDTRIVSDFKQNKLEVR